MSETSRRHQPESQRPDAAAPLDARPRYEPPRIVKKRSVSRATLFSGCAPDACPTPPLVGP